jgi:hypothetical protein
MIFCVLDHIFFNYHKGSQVGPDPDPPGSFLIDLLDPNPYFRLTDQRIRIRYGSVTLVQGTKGNPS